MKDAMEVAGSSVRLAPYAGATVPTGVWAWQDSTPNTGDIIEHEGKDYVVMQVRWSIDDPRIVELRIRPA